MVACPDGDGSDGFGAAPNRRRSRRRSVAQLIEFWFEFASSYSYPAASRVKTLARQRGVDVAWRPFLLGPIFRDQGWADSPFNLYPAKGRYMWRDLERISGDLELAFRRPSAFPRNGLLAARIACCYENEAWIPDFVCAVYRANFADDRDIASRDVLSEILAACGVDSDEALTRATEAANKEKLAEQTERARALGIFGAPTFITDGELFWGNDRLDAAVEWSERGSSRS